MGSLGRGRVAAASRSCGGAVQDLDVERGGLVGGLVERFAGCHEPLARRSTDVGPVAGGRDADRG